MRIVAIIILVLTGLVNVIVFTVDGREEVRENLYRVDVIAIVFSIVMLLSSFGIEV